MNEDRLQFLVTLNDRLRPLRDPVEMQEVAVRLLGEHLRVNRVAFAEIDGDEFLVVRSFVNGVAPLMERGPIAVFGEALRDTYERGETVVVNDIRDDPRFTDVERAGLLANEIAAFAGAMLRKEGRWVAAFGLHSRIPRIWTRDEIALLEQTAERAWAAARARAGGRGAAQERRAARIPAQIERRASRAQ